MPLIVAHPTCERPTPIRKLTLSFEAFSLIGFGGLALVVNLTEGASTSLAHALAGREYVPSGKELSSPRAVKGGWSRLRHAARTRSLYWLGQFRCAGHLMRRTFRD